MTDEQISETIERKIFTDSLATASLLQLAGKLESRAMHRGLNWGNAKAGEYTQWYIDRLLEEFARRDKEAQVLREKE